MKQVVFHSTLVCLSSASDFMIKKQYVLKSQVISPVFPVTSPFTISLGFCSSQWVWESSFWWVCVAIFFFYKQGKNELTRVSEMIIFTKYLNATIDNQRNFKLTFFFFLPWGLWMWIWLDILPKPLLQGHQTERERWSKSYILVKQDYSSS